MPADALPLALEYMSVICIGTVFILGYNAVCAVLRGMGDSKGPLLYVAVAAAANIALDLLFVGPLALGAAGAAMATVCAQALSFFIALFSLRRRGFLRSLSRVDLLPRPVRWASILRIGLPTAVQLSVVNLSYLAVTGLFNACGTACAAAAGVGLKLNTFAAMPCWAVGQAVTTMAGQCMGGGAPTVPPERHGRAWSSRWPAPRHGGADRPHRPRAHRSLRPCSGGGGGGHAVSTHLLFPQLSCLCGHVPF